MDDVNPIPEVVGMLTERIPGVKTQVTITDQNVGFLDVTNGKVGVCVEWCYGRFGLTVLPADAPGVAPEEIFDSSITLVEHIQGLMQCEKVK